MRYTEESLSRGEYVLYEGEVHWKVLVAPGIISLFFLFSGLVSAASSRYAPSLFFLLLAFGIFIFAVQARRATELVLTNRRVIRKHGLITTSTAEVFLSKVEGISIRQGVFGSLLNYGLVLVRGTGGSTDIFPNIAEPLEFRKRMQNQIDALHEQTLPQSRSVPLTPQLEGGQFSGQGLGRQHLP